MTKEQNAGNFGDDLLDGGAVRGRVIFWKGEAAGAWIIGKITGFTTKLFDGQPAPSDVAIFAPAAFTDGGRWMYAREAQIVLGVALRSRINPAADKGKIFAIRFDGFEQTDKGNEARIYTVVERDHAKLTDILGQAEA